MKVLILALALRVGLIVYGEFHDRYFEVKYTDIDYVVFSDAARHVANGDSPYMRDTYRYTPLLAWLLVPNVWWDWWGKFLFIIVDVVTAVLMQHIVTGGKLRMVIGAGITATWLFNPLTATISSRGNAESIMALLVVGVVDLLHRGRFISAGIIYGLAVHFKVYPVIYSLPIWLLLGPDPDKKKGLISATHDIVAPTENRIKFFFSAAGVFALLTAAFYDMYGMQFLYETYLYHLTRKDTQHNFSMYFYILRMVDNTRWAPVVSLLAFLPQCLLVCWAGVTYYRDLPFALFLQTVFFVTANKVCTSQYFVWYLSLLPLVVTNLRMTLKSAVCLTGLWLSGQAVWLFMAYLLEFRHFEVVVLVWLASVLFFCINIFISGRMVVTYKERHQSLDAVLQIKRY